MQCANIYITFPQEAGNAERWGSANDKHVMKQAVVGDELPALAAGHVEV